MPRHDFQCTACAHVFEETISIYDDSDINPRCPQCEAETIKLISQGTSFHLAGKGWFRDGY